MWPLCAGSSVGGSPGLGGGRYSGFKEPVRYPNINRTKLQSCWRRFGGKIHFSAEIAEKKAEGGKVGKMNFQRSTVNAQRPMREATEEQPQRLRDTEHTQRIIELWRPVPAEGGMGEESVHWLSGWVIRWGQPRRCQSDGWAGFRAWRSGRRKRDGDACCGRGAYWRRPAARCWARNVPGRWIINP
jgi:hypothetical protein